MFICDALLLLAPYVFCGILIFNIFILFLQVNDGEDKPIFTTRALMSKQNSSQDMKKSQSSMLLLVLFRAPPNLADAL